MVQEEKYSRWIKALSGPSEPCSRPMAMLRETGPRGEMQRRYEAGRTPGSAQGPCMSQAAAEKRESETLTGYSQKQCDDRARTLHPPRVGFRGSELFGLIGKHQGHRKKHQQQVLRKQPCANSSNAISSRTALFGRFWSRHFTGGEMEVEG